MIISIWPGPTAPRGRRGDVGVDVADGDRDPLGQPGPRGGLRREAAGPAAERRQVAADLLGHEVAEALVQRAQVVLARVAAVLVDGLVAGRARVARLAPAELPDDPVGALDPAVHALVDLGVLLEYLQRLGELPLRGDEAAVARQPGLAALARERVDAVGLRLSGVVLPELGPACGRSRKSSSRHSGVPSASTGSGVEAVKSVAIPMTWSGAMPASATAACTAVRRTSSQSSGSCSAHWAGSRAPLVGSVWSMTPLA